MRKLLILFAALILIGSAMGQGSWYPRSDNYTTSGWIVATSGADITGPAYFGGAVSITGELDQVGNLSNLTPSAATDLVVAINEVDSHADTNAGDISDLVQAAYVNETAINSSVSALTLAAYVNETAINGSIDALTSAAYLNETTINSSITTLRGYVSHLNVIAGGVAGNFTLTGAAAGDALAGVAYFNNTTGNFTELSDLTSEFSIPDTNILNQTFGGTSSLNGYLLVSWVDKTA